MENTFYAVILAHLRGEIGEQLQQDRKGSKLRWPQLEEQIMVPQKNQFRNDLSWNLWVSERKP